MTTHTQDLTKEKLIGEFNTVVSETEQLLKSVSTAGGETVSALRAGVEQNLALAKAKLQLMQKTATEATQAAAQATDDYVQENPWQSVGIAAGAGLLIGALIGFSLSRR